MAGQVRNFDAEAIMAKLRAWRRVGTWWPGSSPFEVAVGAVLTQQTSWTSVEKSIALLRKAGLLTPEAMAHASDEALSAAIKPSGFHRRKSETLKSLGELLRGEDEAVLARPTREALLSVRGVGNETADAILLYCFGEPRFVVDAYALRLFSRLPFAHGGPGDLRASVPKQVRDPASLMELHGLIVELCKSHCRKKPVCEGCPLRDDCARIGVEPPPSAQTNTRPGKRSRRSSRRRR